MFTTIDGEEYESEEEYLMSLKQDDSYHFSIPFEYIKKNYGNGNYDIDTINMEVDVQWSDTEKGYAISYNAPDFYLVDPNEGNGDEDSFYEYDVEWKVLDELESIGIYSEALVGGTGT